MTKTIHVSEDLHELFKQYCHARGIKVGFATEDVLRCILSGSISGSDLEFKENKLVYGQS